MEIVRGAELKDFTTFRIGGKAEYFAEVNSVSDLKSALSVTKEPVVLGGGSNVLISDRGIKGLTVRMNLYGIAPENGVIAAGAGVKLTALSGFYLKSGFSGLEWASGIPGSVGGACIMNAGAFGGSIQDAVAWVEVLKDGAVERRNTCDCGFSYRSSGFKADEIVVRAGFLYIPDDANRILARQREFKLYRNQTQPAGFSAGSVFKKADKPAGFYIEQAGLKGARVGGAEVSKIHANFIVNTGGATANDVLELIALIKSAVSVRFNVTLEEEIRRIGEF